MTEVLKTVREHQKSLSLFSSQLLLFLLWCLLIMISSLFFFSQQGFFSSILLVYLGAPNTFNDIQLIIKKKVSLNCIRNLLNIIERCVAPGQGGGLKVLSHAITRMLAADKRFHLLKFDKERGLHHESIILTFLYCTVIHSLVFHVLHSKFYSITTQVQGISRTNGTTVTNFFFTARR